MSREETRPSKFSCASFHGLWGVRGQLPLRHMFCRRSESWRCQPWSHIAMFMRPTWAHLCPVGPRWAPCWPHEPCYQGYGPSSPRIYWAHHQKCYITPTTLMWIIPNNDIRYIEYEDATKWCSNMSMKDGGNIFIVFQNSAPFNLKLSFLMF